MTRLFLAFIGLCLVAALNANPITTMSNSAHEEVKQAAQADVLVEMNTTAGTVTLRLFGDTPRHLGNFVKLAREGFYDGMLFHRVIQDFMVQTGDPDSKAAPAGKLLGMGGPGYQIDAEIVYPDHFHRRGALAAARQDDSTNPMRQSSGSQFYIVTGHKYTESELDKMEMNLIRSQKQAVVNNLLAANRDTIMSLRRNRDQAGLLQLQDSLQAEAKRIAATLPSGFSDEQRKVYTTVGGAPHLDGAYTVFGQVEKGYDVIDKLQAVETDRNNRPLEDVKIISMKVIE